MHLLGDISKFEEKSTLVSTHLYTNVGQRHVASSKAWTYNLLPIALAERYQCRPIEVTIIQGLSYSC